MPTALAGWDARDAACSCSTPPLWVCWSSAQPAALRACIGACTHRPALQDLTCSGQLSYLGTSWRKDVAFAGYGVPLQVSSDKQAGSGCVDGYFCSNKKNLVHREKLFVHREKLSAAAAVLLVHTQLPPCRMCPFASPRLYYPPYTHTHALSAPTISWRQHHCRVTSRPAR